MLESATIQSGKPYHDTNIEQLLYYAKFCLEIGNLEDSLSLLHVAVEMAPEDINVIKLLLHVDSLRRKNDLPYRFPAGLGEAQTIDGIYGLLTCGDLEALRYAAWNSSGKSVNIGVFNGLSSYVIAKTNPLLQVCGIDAYRGMEAQLCEINHDRSRLAKQNLNLVPNAKLIIGWSTDVAQYWCDDRSLLFIDGDHQVEGALNDLKTWSPFVKKGGIIAVHDAYGNISRSVAKLREQLDGNGPDVICEILRQDSSYEFIMVRGCTEVWRKII
jgi:predicted O-methyltransferase YrrM